MTVMPYKEFQEMVTKAAKEMLQDKGSINPHVLAHKDGTLAYIMLPPNKNLWQIATALGVLQTRSEMYAFISESWYVAMKTPTKEEQRIFERGNIMPSQHPDRKEAIFIIFYSKTAEPFMVSMPFHRGSGPEIIFEEEMRMDATQMQDNRVGNVYKLFDQIMKDMIQKRRNGELR